MLSISTSTQYRSVTLSYELASPLSVDPTHVPNSVHVLFHVQVKQEVTGRARALQPPTELNPAHFRRLVDKNVALKLVTLTPLFLCLNDAPNQ